MILERKVCNCFHFLHIYLSWSDGTRWHDLSFWMLSFKPTFSLSSFTFIKRLFNSSSLSPIRVASAAYLKSLVFLPRISIPACDWSSLAFHMMCSAQKLNKQSESIQPWCTPLPILNQSVVTHLVLTVVSRPNPLFISGLPYQGRYHSILRLLPLCASFLLWKFLVPDIIPFGFSLWYKYGWY